MTLTFDWFLPTSGDGRTIFGRGHSLPLDRPGASDGAATSRLKFLVAFRPGLLSPTLAAQMAASYQRLSGGRLLLNVVTGGQADEQRRFGDYLSHDERYARTGEFLAIVRGAWSGQPFDFSGQHSGTGLCRSRTGGSRTWPELNDSCTSTRS
jgi:alkanesulfonate monooxygenase